MRARRKKIFGIDICKNAVSFVELHKKGKQIVVSRCGIAPLDPSIVDNGVVKDPAALTKVLKQFKIAGTFRMADAAITVCNEPVLLQVLNLPDSSPGEARRFIYNEVKQYAVLPLKNIEIDYCVLRSSDAQAKRVLVGATQSEHLSMTVKAIEKDNINIIVVEPAIMAFIRVCYDMIIRPQRKENIIFLLVRDDTLSLCVFEKQSLDFLRIKKFESDIVSSQERSNWLCREIESVIQFHEIERGSSAEKWQIFVACCPENKYSAPIADEIKGQILRKDTEIAAFQNSLMGIAIDGEDNREIPPVAVGAAMKSLDEHMSPIRLNMMPKEIILSKNAKKQLFIMVNIAASVLLLMLMYISFLINESRNVSLEMSQMRQCQQNVDLEQLAREQADMSSNLQRTTDNVNSIKAVFGNKVWHNWAFMLAELSKNTPPAVHIQELQANSSSMSIEGLAVSYDAINDFVGKLGLCKFIRSAQLADTKQNIRYGGGMLDYSISCSLANDKEVKKD